ncbi:MAG: type I secretion C-terminal target domain-containing protein, partial [Sphingomonas sp.]|nr:type I secretion C-terminal target domain-containing protein [Sphingomonas sp.]
MTLSGGGDGDTLTFYGDNRYSDTATLDGGSGGDSISAIGLGSGTILAGSGDDGITIDTLGGQYTITLGAGSDALYLASTSGGFRAAAAITVTDFTTGNGGDVLYLSGWLSGGALTNQTAGANPFLDGHLRLLQSGTSTLLQADRDGGGDGYVTLVTFQSTTATAFTATNLGGYSQNDEVNIVTGTSGNDFISGSLGKDNISGGDGSDTINLSPGHDVIDGGAGYDSLYANLYNPIFTPAIAARTYTITTAHISDSSGLIDTSFTNIEYVSLSDYSSYDNTFDAGGFIGSNGISLSGGSGNDRLIGSAGNDYLSPGSGANIVDGGAGSDTASLNFFSQTAGISLDNSNPAAVNSITIGGIAAGSITNIENLYYYGGSGADTITGGASYDSLSGGAGDDVLHGGGGSDSLSGGAGADLLDGGAGTDSASYYDASSGISVDLNLQGTAQNTGGSGSDTLISIENLYGSSYSDSLTGDANANAIGDSSGGNDQFFGNAGADDLSISRYGTAAATTVVLSGGADTDTLNFYGDTRYSDTATLDGGDGADFITALGLGNGTIVAGSGNDQVTIDTLGGQYTITLGAGSDTLTLAGTNGAFRAAAAITITDFTAGSGGDVLSLGNWLSGGALTNLTAGTNPFLDGHLRLLQSGTSTLLQADRNGGGDAYATLVTFQNTTATVLTAANLGGLALTPGGSTGTATPGTLTGTANADTLTGSTANETINGLDGNDLLIAGGGTDILHGGNGDDVLVINNPASGSLFDGGAGTDTLRIQPFDVPTNNGFGPVSDPNFIGTTLSSIERLELASTSGQRIQALFLLPQASALTGVEVTGGAGSDALVFV